MVFKSFETGFEGLHRMMYTILNMSFIQCHLENAIYQTDLSGIL